MMDDGELQPMHALQALPRFISIGLGLGQEQMRQ